MTRINAKIHTALLTDQHLCAEIRELPRIFTLVNKRIENGQSFNDIPKDGTLGKGHVKFFYNKLDYLIYRYNLLCIEYTKRYNKISPYNYVVNEKWEEKRQLYEEHGLLCSGLDIDISEKLLVDRITTRLKESRQKPFYKRKEISKKDAINLINFDLSFSVGECLYLDNLEYGGDIYNCKCTVLAIYHKYGELYAIVVGIIGEELYLSVHDIMKSTKRLTQLRNEKINHIKNNIRE